MKGTDSRGEKLLSADIALTEIPPNTMLLRSALSKAYVLFLAGLSGQWILSHNIMIGTVNLWN